MEEQIKQWCYARRAVLTLAAISFVIHLSASLFLYHRFGDNVLYFENEDAYSYVTVANSLVSGQGFSRDGMPSAIRTPGLPLLYAGLMKLPGSFTWWVLLVQNILATATGVIIFYIGKENFSASAGLIAGYATVLEPYMMMTANLATTETLFNFILVICLGYFLRWLKNLDSYRPLLFSALSAGVLILVRPVALYLPLVFLGLAAARLVSSRHNGKKIVLTLGLWVILCAGVVAPWSIRQYLVFGSARVTNIDAYMFYYKIAPLVVADQNKISYNSATKILDDRLRQTIPNFDPLILTNTFQYNNAMFKSARQIIFSKPSVIIKFYTLSLFPTLTGTGYEYMLEDIFNFKRSGARISYSDTLARRDWTALAKSFFRIDIFQIALFGGAALWLVIYLVIGLALRRRVWWQRYGWATAVLLIFLAYFILFSLGPASHARYRMPTFPLWFLFLAASLDFLRARYIIRRKALKLL